MNYHLGEQNHTEYIDCAGHGLLLRDEQDALDLLTACGEHQAPRLLLDEENLAEDFFQLRTGLAGKILLKFSNYAVKVAAIFPPERVKRGKFRDMVLETNRGNEFRVFSEREKAVEWLTRSR